MGFEDRPGNRPIGSKPPQRPLPFSDSGVPIGPGGRPSVDFLPGVVTPPGSSIGYKPAETAPMKQLPDNIFGFFMLMMGL